MIAGGPVGSDPRQPAAVPAGRPTMVEDRRCGVSKVTAAMGA